MEYTLASKKSTLWLRARIIQGIRRFFMERDYLEVETPQLIPAPAPEPHINAIEAGHGFLHTSPELCMKRLLAAKYSRIFQICRVFREGERGGQHLPEFTLLEWYRSGIDYFDLMHECEEMIQSVARELGNDDTLIYQGHPMDLTSPWRRMALSQAFLSYASMSMGDAFESGRFDEVLVEMIEPHLGITAPIFLYDYPASQASLARLRRDDPSLAERFELYMGGLEIANAFSELIDPHEQERRFQEEREERMQKKKSVYPMPDRFLKSLRDMPPSAGIALGVDRLVMLFVDQREIDHVVAFTPEDL